MATQAVYKLQVVILLVYGQLSDTGMVSTRNVHNVRKMTVVTSTSRHNTKRPHRDHCHPGQSYHAHKTLFIDQYGAKIVTYLSAVKLWFTRKAAARAMAPES